MFKKIISILISLLIIILWFYLVDIKTVFLYFGQIKVGWLLVALSLSLLHTFLSAYKLSLFLNLIKKLSPFYIWGLLYIGAIISLLSSFPAGGFSMAYLLKTKTNAGYHKIVGILLIDYTINILITSGVAIIGILYFFYYGRIKIPLVTVSTILYILIVLSFIMLLSILVLKKIGLSKYILSRKLYILNSQFRTGIKLFKNKWRIFFRAIMIALINVILNGFMFIAFYKAFSKELIYVHTVFALNILSLLNMLPGLPFKLGQYELFSVITLPNLLGVDKNLVFSVAFIEHSINLSVSFLFGFIALYFLHSEIYENILLKIRNLTAKKSKHQI